MKKKFLGDIEVRNQRVFVRTDFDVPMNDSGEITDDTKLRETLPTLQHLLKEKCQVVCGSHLGCPQGRAMPKFSLKPVAKRLGELLGTVVHFVGDPVGKAVEAEKEKLSPGEILLLENLRFHPGETELHDDFSRELARRIDLYVNDAFSASHRAHTSIYAVPKTVPLAVSGFWLKKEIEYLSLATDNPPPGYLLILGGAQVSEKIPLIESLLGKIRTLLIGGDLAFTFLKSRGVDVGASPVDDSLLDTCRDILKQASRKNISIFLPKDHVAAFSTEPNVTVKITRRGESIPQGMMGLDIGMETVFFYLQEIEKAELILWDGPMGYFEMDMFSGGTLEIAKAVAASKAASIIGGSDTIEAVRKAGVHSKFSHISSTSTAWLQFLSGKPLPGLEALTDA